MESPAIIYRDPKNPERHERLVTLCREVGFSVELRDADLDPEAVSNALPDAAHVLFIPLSEDDCKGVKILQIVKLGQTESSTDEPDHRIVILYSKALPDVGYLSLAFREGADDVIALDSDESQLGNQARRALTRLGTVQRELNRARTGVRETRALAVRCEELERENTRWQERVHVLARAAAALASGELSPKVVQPTLLVVGRSEAMTKLAVQCAEQLQFLTRAASDATQALEYMRQEPANVVLSDVRLSDADAPGLAKRIRGAAKGRLPYFIAWSSDAKAEGWLLAPEQGIDDFVLKRNDASARLLLSAALLRGIAP